MPRRPPRLCACGHVHHGTCPATTYTHAERQRMRAAVQSHIREHGWWCPGDNHHDAHPTHDLTADHITPHSQGGRTLQVLCRTANSRKGTT